MLRAPPTTTNSIVRKGLIKQIFSNNSIVANDEATLKEYYKHPNPYDAAFLISKPQFSLMECEKIYKSIPPEKFTVGLVLNMINMYKRNNIKGYEYLWDEVKELLHRHQLSNESSSTQMNSVTWGLVIRGLCLDNRIVMAYELIEKRNCFLSFEIDKKTISFLLLKSVDDSNIHSEMMKLVFDYVLEREMIPDIIDYTCYLKKLINERNYNEIEHLISKKNISFDNLFFAKVFSAFAKFGNKSSALNSYNRFKLLKIIPNSYCYSSLMNMLTKFGFIDESIEIFNQMITKNSMDTVTLTIMIKSLVENDRIDYSIDLVKEYLHLLDSSSLFRILNSMVKETKELQKCQELFYLIEGLFHLSSRHHGRFIDMLILNDQLNMAINHFKKLVSTNLEIDEHIYSSLLNGIVNNNLEDFKNVALDIINSIQKPYSIILATTIIKTFSKYGMLNEFQAVFDEFKYSKDVILWNTTILAYGHNNRMNESLSIFNQFIKLEIEPNPATFISIFTILASTGSIELGKQIYSQHYQKIENLNDILIKSSYMNMLAKCGDLENSINVFNSLPISQITTPIVNVIMSAYSKHGKGLESLALFNKYFKEMTFKETLKPNHETFLILLYACSHGNRIDDALSIYYSMSKEYGIEPTISHHTALIDTFSRNGLLEEAEQLIHKFKEKDVILLMSILGGCRRYNQVERAERIFNEILKINENYTPAYVLMANMYAMANRDEQAIEIRKRMDMKGLAKVPGQSHIEIDGTIHSFLSQDITHPRKDEIHAELFKLMKEIEMAGYTPETSWVTKSGVHDYEEKKNLLYLHSEKIAMAFAFLVLPPGSTITIFNHLRVCGDCHSAATFISQVRNCKIIFRDPIRFHHFENGKCSCGDLW